MLRRTLSTEYSTSRKALVIMTGAFRVSGLGPYPLTHPQQPRKNQANKRLPLLNQLVELRCGNSFDQANRKVALVYRRRASNSRQVTQPPRPELVARTYGTATRHNFTRALLVGR